MTNLMALKAVDYEAYRAVYKHTMKIFSRTKQTKPEEGNTMTAEQFEKALAEAKQAVLESNAVIEKLTKQLEEAEKADTVRRASFEKEVSNRLLEIVASQGIDPVAISTPADPLNTKPALPTDRAEKIHYLRQQIKGSK